MVSNDFRAYLEERMEESGHSLRKVAQDAGISPSYLSRILAGERGLPPNEALLDLGRALGVRPPEQLLVQAGRIPTRSLGRLSEREMDELYEAIRKLMSLHRRKKKSKAH